MDTIEAIKTRRSVRQFKRDGQVSDETVRRILEAAIMAPSAGNGQSWRFIVVRDPEIKHRLANDAGHQLFIDQAPVAIVVVADLARASEKYGERGASTYALQETAAATMNIMLTANALGLGSCWVGAFDEAKAAEILGLKGELRPVAMIPIGVPAEPSSRVPPRRAIDEVAEFR